MPDTEVVEAPNQLAVIAQKTGLAPHITEAVVTTFIPLVEEAGKVIAEAAGVTVTDATQVTEIRQSRALRLKLREVRIDVDKARKLLKEESLRRGQFIDEVAGFIKDKIEPVEQRLDEQEKFAERKEAERKAALKDGREKMLAELGVDATHYHLADMTEEAFDKLLGISRIARDQKVEMERKAAEEREARIAEEARVREENARLRREAEDREAAAKAERERLEAQRRESEEQARQERAAAEAVARKERERLEAVARGEREARERLEAQERARKAEEARQAAEAEKARRAAARAPDRDKVLAIIPALKAIPMPEVSSEEAAVVVRTIGEQRDKFVAWITKQAETLA